MIDLDKATLRPENSFDKALARFRKQKPGALARDEARKKALRIKKERKERMERRQEAKKQLRDEQPARMDDYVNAVFKWCITPKKKRGKAPSARDFGVTNESKAMRHLFHSERWLAHVNAGQNPGR